MTAHEYQSGRWTALVTDGALALLHPGVPDDVARELWQLTSTGRRLGAWVEYLAAAGIATLPSFAMVESHPEGWRVLVRGEVDVELGGRVVSGRGYATWREEVVPAAADVTIRAETTDGGWLPVTGGIVRAASARLAVPQETASGEPVPDFADEDDVELTVARMPALAAAVGASTPDGPSEPDGVVADTDDDLDELGVTVATPSALADEAAGPSFAASAPATDGPAAAAAPSADVVAARPADDASGTPAPGAADGPAAPATDTDGAAALAAQPAGGGAAPTGSSHEDAAPAPRADAAPSAAAEEQPEDSDDYDFLLWPTEQVRAHEAAAPPSAAQDEDAPSLEAEPAHEAEPAPPVPGAASDTDREARDIEATRDPEPDEAPVLDTGGIIDSVPGLRRPPVAAAPAGAPVPLPPPVGVPVAVPAAPAPSTDAPGAQDHDDGDHDGETIMTSELPSTSGTPVAYEATERPRSALELVLSTGPRIEMDRPVLLGRAPEAARFTGSELPRLVSVSNPERDISSTHVEIRPAGDHVVVTDMNSTNGTILHLSDQPAIRLQPGTGVPVAAGAVVELGTGVTVTVERVEGVQ